MHNRCFESSEDEVHSPTGRAQKGRLHLSKQYYKHIINQAQMIYEWLKSSVQCLLKCHLLSGTDKPDPIPKRAPPPPDPIISRGKSVAWYQIAV
jgi:hypothetical protein